jgi:hypothetical protein
MSPMETSGLTAGLSGARSATPAMTVTAAAIPRRFRSSPHSSMLA